MSRLKSRFVKVTKQFRKSFRGFLPSIPLFLYRYRLLLLFSLLRLHRRLLVCQTLFACRDVRWSSAFYIILISPTVAPREEKRPFLRPRGTLCLNGVGDLFPARTNKGIDYVGHRAPRVVLNGRRFARGMPRARTASEKLGCGRLKCMQIAHGMIFRQCLRSRDK